MPSRKFRYQIDIKASYWYLCGKERRHFGEFVEKHYNGDAQYDPATSKILFIRKPTNCELQIMDAYIAGMSNANFWQDDDLDIEDKREGNKCTTP